MMIAVSLPLLLAYSLLLSGVLTWVRSMTAGLRGAALATLAVCAGMAAFEILTWPATVPRSQAWQVWAMMFAAPSAILLAVSRLELFRVRPWTLLLLGPLTFIVGIFVAGIVFSIVFARAAWTGG